MLLDQGLFEKKFERQDYHCFSKESFFVAASFLQDERIQNFVVAVEKTFEVEIEIVVVEIFDLFAAVAAAVECLSEAATAVVVVV